MLGGRFFCAAQKIAEPRLRGSRHNSADNRRHPNIFHSQFIPHFRADAPEPRLRRIHAQQGLIREYADLCVGILAAQGFRQCRMRRHNDKCAQLFSPNARSPRRRDNTHGGFRQNGPRLNNSPAANGAADSAAIFYTPPETAAKTFLCSSGVQEAISPQSWPMSRPPRQSEYAMPAPFNAGNRAAKSHTSKSASAMTSAYPRHSSIYP